MPFIKLGDSRNKVSFKRKGTMIQSEEIIRECAGRQNKSKENMFALHSFVIAAMDLRAHFSSISNLNIPNFTKGKLKVNNFEFMILIILLTIAIIVITVKRNYHYL